MNDQDNWQWMSSGLTHVGNVRAINEDAILDRPEHGLWVVADGMGGHEAGDVASAQIVSSLSRQFPESEPVDWVEDQLRQVNYELYLLSRQRGENAIIGSTVVALLALQGYCMCIWAGDSRVYRMRNFELEQLTTDHSEVEELIAGGFLDRSEAEGHPGENVITRAVGGAETISLEMQLFPLNTGDRYLVCSDGLYKALTSAQISAVMEQGSTTDVSRELMRQALAGRCPDNVSLIVVDFTQR